MQRFHGIVVGSRKAVFGSEAVLDGDDDRLEMQSQARAEDMERSGSCAETDKATAMVVKYEGEFFGGAGGRIFFEDFPGKEYSDKGLICGIYGYIFGENRGSGCRRIGLGRTTRLEYAFRKF